jgi:hypothetical protein
VTLIEVLQSLATYPAEATILAEEPWSAQSRAVVCAFPSETPVDAMTKDGRRYFLEVAIARDLIEDLLSSGCDDEIAMCDRVICYAINDA